MKKYWIYIMMSLGLAACSDEVESPYGEGIGALTVAAELETQITIPVITKGADFTNLKVEDLFIRVYDERGTEQVNKTYGQLLEKDPLTGKGFMPILLPAGNYTVKASTSTKEADGVMATPYFVASSEVKVDERVPQTVQLECRFQSIGVELQLSDQFKHKLKTEPNNYSYKVSISNGKATWEFSPEQMTVGYFVEPCDELVATVDVRLNDMFKWYPTRVYRIKNKEQAPQLGEYYIITLDAGEEPETNEPSLRAVQINHER